MSSSRDLRCLASVACFADTDAVHVASAECASNLMSEFVSMESERFGTVMNEDDFIAFVRGGSLGNGDETKDRREKT